MEHMEDIDGHTANPETVEAIRHFRGYAKIDLSHFRLEDDHVLGSRPVGQNVESQNVLRLLKLFESVGCDREDPENYVPVLISQNTLSQAIDDSRTTQVVLLNGIEPPNLILGHGTRLLCLQGKSRIRAAQEFFSPGERWWGARLYLDTAARDRLREKYSNEQNFGDGDIYRNLRYHQLRGNGPRAEAWWARWSSPKRRHVRQMQKQERLLNQFDRLLPYVGLWASVNVKLFRRIVDSRCYEESINYLDQTFKVWSVLPHDAAALVDAQSVHLLEGLMPAYSLVDQKRIQDLMNNREIFPALIDSERRSKVLERLLQVSGRILSLHTFSQDLLFLELPSKALRGLLPKTFKGSVRNALLKKYVHTENSYIIQTSAAGYRIAAGTLKAASYLSYVPLWLCAIRLFVSPLKDSHTSEAIHTFSSIRGLPFLADEAISLGFSSTEIKKLSNQDANEQTCRYFVEHMCQVELYEPEPKRLSDAVRRIQNTLKQLQEKRKIADGVPVFSKNATSEPLCRRYNRPLASHLESDRCYFFIEHIYGTDQSIAHHPTSIAVTREIIFSFFGKEPIYDQILELPESPEHEDHPTGSPGIPLERPTLPWQTSSYMESTPPTESWVHEDHSSGSRDVPFERSILPGQSSILSSYVPSGTNKLTVPQASGFEDFSGDPNTRLAIAANRSTDEILNMWYASQDDGLIVFYMFSTRQFYKFWNDDFALQSTIFLLSKDHFFMHYVGKKGQSLPDERILAVAKEERLLFVGPKTAPGISITASASVDDIEKYVSMYDTKTGKRKAGRLTRSRQEEEEEEQDDPKRTREVHPQDEIDEEL
ncbi:hypothetical protein I7I51_03917 [Histoplasma capsulatum]|uniref:Uncharacterized protein n=2 Tax=Histoplasma TaxID=5036 RepID=A0A8A1M916_AJECA|nr:hypothetical protein I7I51_03917 [Histoplasma capsulatum]